MVLPILATDVGGAIGSIGLIVLFVIWLAAKSEAKKSTACIHCGHDSGIPASRAPICQACGRNRTILSSRRARKR